MRIQFLNGGLANQAFQYIFARYYELSTGEKMYLDDSYFALNTVHNGYELEKVFGIKAPMLSECFDEEVWGFILDERRKGKSVPTILCENQIPFYMLSEVGPGHQEFNPFEGEVVSIQCNEYHPEILRFPDDVYYHGYWINKNWFAKYKDTFLKEFSFPEITDPVNKRHLERIQKTNSVSIHIRRGDYVTVGWAFQEDVYSKLVEGYVSAAPGKWELFVFSDDIPWCREHWKELGFGAFEDVTYIEGNVQGKNYIDMQLMSRCKGMIMSNSAFCYLAALLNTTKRYWLNPTTREV
ncbi:MAG: alpha-1,2-fucosyltransferase [Candidatus Gastranaerophilales bacterium]|nr:alpha-1,2-fucosyltransferase [Candidatus Gastranaerophilales bacterium]